MTEQQGKDSKHSDDVIVSAAKQAAQRDRVHQQDPEPSLGARLGQIGVLGWATITPILLGLVIGRSLDRLFSTGIMFSAAFIMLGAIAGMWSAWRWMHRS